MNEIKVPILPESITDAVVVAINKNAGDIVRAGETLFDLETDKVVLDVVSEENGVLTEIIVNNGDTVVESQVLATLEIKEITDNEITEKTEVVSEVAIPSARVASAGPAARKAMNEAGISRDEIIGSGKDGRILKEDIYKNNTIKAPTNTTNTVNIEGRIEERVVMSRMRQTIAKRLLDATNQTAMLTTFNEVDMTNIMNIRKKYQDSFVKENDVKLGFMSLFVKAATESLKKFPAINSFIDGDEIVYHGYTDISIAVSSNRGLVVPVLRDTQNLSLAQIENQIIDFAKRASAGKLELAEMSGGTFTITNGGTFGSLMSTPIINPPQSAVLGMHNIVKRPVVINNEIVIRDMMYLAMSYDHRIVDGRDAVLFLRNIKEIIEDPTRIFLGL